MSTPGRPVGAGAGAAAGAVPREAFAGFAREHPAEPLYAALARHVVAEPALAALLAEAPATQRKPVLWFAALHDRLLALAEAGGPLPPHAAGLAAYFANLGGARAPDDALPAAVRAFTTAEAPALREAITTRATQTNEIGRSAVLWAALAAIAAQHGGRPLALFDFGCSAGLNLLVDAVGVQWRPDAAAPIDVAAGEPMLQGRLLGGHVPPRTPWRLVARLGVDPAPVNLADARARRWLRACLWPSEQARHTRFAQAVALAQRMQHPVQAADDALAALGAWLPTLPHSVVPVLFNSWVLAYFTPDELARHTARVHALVRTHGLVWLSAEDDARTLATTGMATLPQRPPAAGTPTWWALTQRGKGGEGGAPEARLLACSHPHGEWLQWLGE